MPPDDTSFPAAPVEITIDWLTSALRVSGAISGTTTISHSVVEAIGDLGGVNGETYRIRIEYAHGEGPRSLIAKFPVDRPGARRTAAFQRWYEREVSFYTTLAATSEMRVPACFAASIDANGDYVLLLEDLHALHDGDQLAGCSVEQAREAVRAIARLHARWWNAPPPVSDAMPETTVGVDRAERVRNALERVSIRATDRGLLPPAVAVHMPRFVEAYVALLERMASAPVTVIHGDYRLDNVFFDEAMPRGEGVTSVAVIDWQFLCRCRGMYDVGYFLGLDLDPADRRAHERDLIASYLEVLRERGVEGYGAAEAWDDYRRALLLGFAVFLIGAAGEQPNERMARVHEIGVARIATAIEETDAFAVLEAPRG